MNFRQQIDAPTAPRIRSPYGIDLHATPLGPTIIQPVLSFGSAAIPFASLGVLRIDPATSVALPWVRLSNAVHDVIVP